MSSFRHLLLGKFGRAHPNIKDIFYWARNDYGFPKIQEWELTGRYTKWYFVTQGAMQSKVVRSLCEKI